MNMWLVVTLLASITPAQPPAAANAGLDGSWQVSRLERNGTAIDAGPAQFVVRAGRLILDDEQLELCADSQVRRWPAPPPQIVYPFTPSEWAARFGQPVYYPCGQQWVITPMGDIILVLPMPYKVVPPPAPLGVYVATEGQLAIKLSSEGNSLLLVLQRPLPMPQKVR